ncbi:glycoside hydrolase family 2 TIM barrel-domain containing protein [Pelagicoccus sp. SDUM812003]|uniref:glycoside hydrolase family 2 TIM barrel-domain containing protein n=1 Tax=Pelagicoccus sp. SDUM812003 TaxID=3041267 RepID=UPI00280CC70E|nr:glycoside hydrolase family 2 TIM barrel-domain containing protein [Pelagicoccus sp. SDUM812003]MDQ8205018.1 glycoside hydrolase family 2 TIM barrel-domain containing protein [Pelagicoccus sp. SDUM812003]
MAYFRERLVDGWSFRILDQEDGPFPVFLPHSPFVADLDGCGHWQGLCEYTRTLKVGIVEPDTRYVLYFGAAMHTAEIAIDGECAGSHSGGYLPFEIDVTRWLADGREHILTAVLDNRDDGDVPPGKPVDELDFCFYGGLYRHVELRAYPSLHISDPISAGVVGSGGVFVRTGNLDAKEATLLISAHVVNDSNSDRAFVLRYAIENEQRELVVSGEIESGEVPAGKDQEYSFSAKVSDPVVWDLASPHLYTIAVELVSPNGSLIHRVQERFGIRHIAVSRSGGLQLNGKRIRPRGTNRHQDYPRIGYALSDAAQYRDAKRIKEAGFDYVRLSHYPQSPAFLDACDELGILVMNCIPGWQFIGGDAFREACYQNARELVRRDRNHPCVIFWELSLNETEMDEAFMTEMMRIGHEEYPGDQMLVCGWIDRFDVFIHSRQHGKIHTWKNEDKALVIAEYGDWEFYASNEGFDQKTGAGLLADWSNSRAFRREGERRLRRQAHNHIVALNDTLSSPAVTDGLWSMFDYPRGYSPTRAACGVMDIHRLPKYSYFFFKSQRAPSEGSERWSGGPMVYIASRWVENSILDVLVFSNCEEVALKLNDEEFGPLEPSRTSNNQRLPFPPFLFQLEKFERGALEAVGFIGGVEVANHQLATPGAPSRLTLQIADEGIQGEESETDVLFAHARVVDEDGNICKTAMDTVAFECGSGVEIVGPKDVPCESGVASVVLVRHPGCKSFSLSVSSVGLAGAKSVYPESESVIPLGQSMISSDFAARSRKESPLR